MEQQSIPTDRLTHSPSPPAILIKQSLEKPYGDGSTRRSRDGATGHSRGTAAGAARTGRLGWGAAGGVGGARLWQVYGHGCCCRDRNCPPPATPQPPAGAGHLHAICGGQPQGQGARPPQSPGPAPNQLYRLHPARAGAQHRHPQPRAVKPKSRHPDAGFPGAEQPHFAHLRRAVDCR